MYKVGKGLDGWIHYRGRKIGKIKREKFICHRNAGHFYRKLQSFGIAEDVLRYLIHRNVQTWTIVYAGTKRTHIYKIPLLHVLTSGTLIQEEDYEAQYHVPVDDFTEITESDCELIPAKEYTSKSTLCR